MNGNTTIIGTIARMISAYTCVVGDVKDAFVTIAASDGLETRSTISFSGKPEGVSYCHLSKAALPRSIRSSG